jgi:hypothetical protein
MVWSRLGYIALCVLVPAAWGLVVVWLSNRVEAWLRRRHKAKNGEQTPAEMPPLDYHI